MRLFLIVGVASVLFAQDAPDALLGRWRTTFITKGGLGALYEFQTGGVVLIRPGAIAPGTYTVKGNEISLPPLIEGGPPNVQRMDFSKPGQLSLYKGKDLEVELSRVGKQPPGKPTVVGEWVGMRLIDGQKMEMRMFFYANGKSMFLLPFSTQQAKYSLNKGRMTLQLPDGRAAEGPYRLVGNTLTIPGIRSGSATKLSRY